MSQLHLTDEAEFSPCGRYRYRLTRTIGGSHPVLNMILLNPSTATAEADDPTSRRCIGFARLHGYGKLLVTNLFGLRATDPRQLRQVDDPIGPGNDDAIVQAALEATTVWVAWGVHGGYRDRDRAVLTLLADHGIAPYRGPLCFGMTRDGFPRHPLYLPGGAEVGAYEWWRRTQS